MQLLLIEDDRDAAGYLVRALTEAGYRVDHAADAIVADRMLPHIDGLTIIEVLRKQGNRTPVLVLSALGSVDQRVEGLRAGGDDYLTKPFALSELLARLEALLRRGQVAPGPETRLRVADLELDLLSRTVTRAGRRIELTAREFQLLEFLLRRAGQVVTRTMLLEGVWDLHFDPQTNVIDVHMSRLRQAIDKGFDRPLLHTIRGAGYTVRAD
jgi:two-component system OmpR family response regulator